MKLELKQCMAKNYSREITVIYSDDNYTQYWTESNTTR